LSDPAILDRIVDALDPRPDDIVIEVGPGRGSLTRRLAPRVGTVIAVERDDRLVRELAGGGGQEPSAPSAVPPSRRSAALPPNVTVVHGDALELDFGTLVEDALTAHRSPLRPFKLVGNIPYYLTSPLIDKALTPPRSRLTVFLMQREVADRLVAEPGGKTYGAISVGVRSVAQVERLFAVKPGSFRPPPKVDSAVVRFVPLDKPLVADGDHAAFRGLVTAVFAQRRKQIGRSLRRVTGADKSDVRALLAQLDIDQSARPEQLSPNDFARLFQSLPG
jgi:16S rRNA (adenine1518-N6/adenine1519-N6)-dimethyltransferase